MRFVLSLSAFILLALGARAQLRVSALSPSAVPAALKRTGRVVQALRYTDRTGTYTVLATERGPAPDPAALSSDGRRADLYAYQYPATGPAPSWQVHDFVADCPLDLEARFLPKSLSVTDLDQDGTAEVWLAYRTTCRGDVSPSIQKIIMYEGPRKYAMRGTARIAVGNGQFDGGTYTLDAAWQAAPVTFRQHAARLWQQHRDEKLSE
jgi:hypothetical protein